MSIVINRVYTKTGDRGTSRLAGGQEVDKDSDRLEAYGTVDELSAVIGVLVESMSGAGVDPLRDALIRIQNELFDLGGELATLPADRHEKQALVGDQDVLRLESEIDRVNADLPTLRSFILPGGGLVSAYFHQARTVSRRAERRLVSLHRAEPQREETLRYLNRLSDWLFVMGRKASRDAGREELLWRPGERERSAGVTSA
ncbi:MAG: cob(I)yrinic acid a,c-diamide adenosyltransferase [Deltaproteobacteria bacterium]|nr:cob(I)yrinic acid a,c-diamide adenosyltransferase [Deltaproteobacteria bacterium]